MCACRCACLSARRAGVEGRCEFRFHLLSLLTVTLTAALAAPALGGSADVRVTPAQPDAARIDAAVRLMAGFRDTSRRQAAQIRQAYAAEVRRLALRNRQSLQAAHGEGALTTLFAFDHHNLRLRLDGRHPIGELDLPNQELYVAARPEAVGCLLHVASRVRSGALEVTSLVRHRAYQHALARRNANARTAVPTHAMGLAFDVSILHASPHTAREIGDVLTRMAAEGDLFFIAEERQLVFHVVPTPQRREYYAAVSQAMAITPPPSLIQPAWTVTQARAFVAPDVPPVPDPSLGTSLDARRPTHYAGLVGWLFLSGLGAPPGEDLLLAAAGALVGRGVLAWWPVILLAAVSIAATDTILFWLGRTTARLARRPPILSARTLARLDAFIGRWGRLAIAVARFVPGSRTIVFASAGAHGLRPRTFILIDACAALVWAALLVSAGTWVIEVLFGGSPPPRVGLSA